MEALRQVMYIEIVRSSSIHMLDRPRAQNSGAKMRGSQLTLDLDLQKPNISNQVRCRSRIALSLNLSRTPTIKHPALHIIPVVHADFDRYYAIFLCVMSL